MRRKYWSDLLAILLSAALVMQLVGCGYLLHPERRGQRGGNVDPGIAILDGLGLLLFIVPGLIAFAVDFTSGTIYYPEGRKSVPSKKTNIEIIQIGLKGLNGETICQKVQEYARCPRNFTLQEAKIIALNNVEEIGGTLEKVVNSGYKIN